MIDAPLWSAHVTELGSTSVVRLSGELDMDAADPLRLLLIEHLDRPADVVVNLAAATFLDSAALGTLIVAYRHAQGHDRRFVLSEPAGSVRRVLDIGGVYDLLVEPGDDPPPPA